MASKGAAILKLLQGTDVKELNHSLKAYLAPLSVIRGFGKEHAAEKQQHTLAKEYVPFLVQLLKICGAKLAFVPSKDDFAAVNRADEMFSAMVIAVDSLILLRTQLSGSFFEIELQRYGLVRRLMAWKRYGEALLQSQVLFRSLCRLTSIQDSKVSTVNRATSGRTSKGGAHERKSSTVSLPAYDDTVLSPPREADVGSGLPALVVAVAVDLLWCLAESTENSLPCFQIAARLPEQLTPWIRLLDPGTASKQRDGLFRAIYKLTLSMVADPTKFDPILVERFCILALKHCSSSTQCEQYAKVARKLFSTLSSQGSDWCRKSLEICTSIFAEVLSLTELRGLWNSYDFSELVEWFARSCQTSSQVQHGWSQIYKLIDHIEQVFPCAPVVMTGLYAVGLVLMQADSHKVNSEIRMKESRSNDDELANLHNLERFSEYIDFFSKGRVLLQSAENVLKLWLQRGQLSSMQQPTDNGSVTRRGHSGPGSSDIETVDVKGRTFVTAARALHFVQKPFTKFVLLMWNLCCASLSEKELPHRLFNSALQKMLQLFYPVVEEGMRCSDLGDSEKDIFRKGYQMALQASFAALKSSLLLSDGVQGNYELIRDLIYNLQPEEKLWLMSSTYNMGVQLFNIKKYDLACWPLDLAYKAARAKVKSSSFDSTSGASVNETVSEACAKCLALVDARSRNGEPGLARVIVTDGLVEWAQAQAKMHTLKSPQSLVRSFVKLICMENQIVQDIAQQEVLSLYSFIRDIRPPLPAGIVGGLLEEEHAICKAMEEQFPDTCHIMKEQIMECLLKKLYVGSDFVLERSRVLIRKCRDLRMHGAENLPICIEFVSEAVVSLEATLKAEGENTPGRIAGLEKQLAVAYSIMGICHHEMHPCSQEFLPNVVLSLNMWKKCVFLSDVIRGGLPERGISLPTAANEEESMVLLLYLSDLLSIQGYSVLLHEAQEVILRMIRNSRQSVAEKEWMDFWMEGRASHLLCGVPFPADFLSAIRRTFDATANADEFWQGCFGRLPGSLLEALRHSVDEAAGSSRSTVLKLEASQHIKNMIHARSSDGQKSSQFVLLTAGLHHLLAQLSLVKGDLNEAISNAKEAFQLRSRLFKCVFHNSGKSASGPRSTATSKTSGSGDPSILQLRERLGSVATWSWPFPVKIQHCISHPSQWRILGDYIESLMQVGVINEQMGAVDEAERCFREGHRVALAQNLPWALTSFSSCLGEVHRKRQLWESAESYFIQAKQVLDDWEANRFCKCCIMTGKALLEMRTGDLARHYWYCQQSTRKEHDSHLTVMGCCPVKTLTSALSHYSLAVTSLSELLEEFGGIDVLNEKGSSNSLQSQRSMLRSLQMKGKSVSLEILSNNLEEAGISGPKTCKPSQKTSVQTSTKVLAYSKAVGTDMERDLSALCNDMRLTSLASGLVDSLQVESKKSKVKPNDSRNGLRCERRNGLGKATLSEMKDDQYTGSDGKDSNIVVQKDSELVLEAKISGLTGAAKICHPSSCGTLGHSFSIEDWPACQWTQLGLKLMSRVLLQRGKCYIHMGELNDACRILEKAMSTLNMCRLLRPEIKAVGRSPFPVEEGAVLYHMSRLFLESGQRGDDLRDVGGSKRDSDNLEMGKSQGIQWLYCAFSLCRQVPLLLHKIAKLLAILHVPLLWDILPSAFQGSVAQEEMAEVAAYFHQVSLGTTVRQQHLAVLDSKLDDATLEDNPYFRPCLGKACLENMQRALRIDPLNVGGIGAQAKEFWDSLPSSLVCCISFVSAEDLNMLKGNCLRFVEDADHVTDWLLVTRLSLTCKPVVVLLPVRPILESPPHVGRSKTLERSTSAYDLSDDEDDDCLSSTEDQKIPSPEILSQISTNNSTVLRRVTAEFGSILDESRRSTSGSHPVSTLEEKSIWWKWRMELDRRLSMLLRTVEDSWLGPFKCLLLGEPQQAHIARSFELCSAYLLELMNSMITSERSGSIDLSFLKILLQAVGCLTASELEKAVAEILGFIEYQSCDIHPNECGADCNACKWKMGETEKYEQIKQASKSFRAAYLLSVQACQSDMLKCVTDENDGKRRSRRQAKGKAGPTIQSQLEIVLQMVSDGPYSPDALLKRQPLQLILDSDSQALPWESLPILREHEIYRMPSLGTMHAIHIRHQCDSVSDLLRATDSHKGQARKTAEKKAKAVKRSSRATKEVDSEKRLDVTCVNPYNTYYILNPNGDLPSTQAAFEDWFTTQLGWKGRAGTVPTAEEYQMGLQKHDLFVYLGHGSGDQFLPERYVRELDHCAASLLMGCSSGRLSSRGEYQPVGVVLSYLMAGCPTIVANLWDVTDGDIDRFSRSLLHNWLASKPETASFHSEKGIRDISDCELAMRERQNVNTIMQTRSTSKVTNMILENQMVSFKDVHRMGSEIGQSRNACRLPHLIGASPVCYGVPTGLSKQACLNSTQ